MTACEILKKSIEVRIALELKKQKKEVPYSRNEAFYKGEISAFCAVLYMIKEVNKNEQ